MKSCYDSVLLETSVFFRHRILKWSLEAQKQMSLQLWPIGVCMSHTSPPFLTTSWDGLLLVSLERMGLIPVPFPLNRAGWASIFWSKEPCSEVLKLYTIGQILHLPILRERTWIGIQFWKGCLGSIGRELRLRSLKNAPT